jgi:hypothetical protein
MTEDDAETKLKGSLRKAKKRNPGTGVRVTIESFAPS